MSKYKVEGIRRHRTPDKAELSRIYDELLARPNVYGCFIGHRESGGAQTGQLSVVCLVNSKPAERRIAQAGRVPRTISWREGSSSRRLRSDVQRVRDKFVTQSIVGPGDRLEFSLDHATTGAIIDHPEFNRAATTAAHLFPPGTRKGTQVSARSGDQTIVAKLARRVLSDDADYAILSLPDNAVSDNLYLDRIRVGPIYTPSAPEDLGREVHVLTSKGNAIPTHCRAIDARVDLGSMTIAGAILTDAVTKGGDSGTCLVDDRRRLWGMLRGVLGNKYSLFMPANILLKKEGADLV